VHRDDSSHCLLLEASLQQGHTHEFAKEPMRRLLDAGATLLSCVCTNCWDRSVAQPPAGRQEAAAARDQGHDRSTPIYSCSKERPRRRNKHLLLRVLFDLSTFKVSFSPCIVAPEVESAAAEVQSSRDRLGRRKASRGPASRLHVTSSFAKFGCLLLQAGQNIFFKTSENSHVTGEQQDMRSRCSGRSIGGA